MTSSTSPISAEIITTGTEILLGEIVDTNAAWIAQQLRDAGVNLYFKTTVGDNVERLQSILELGLSRSDVLIVTGGLGPTADDITRQAIAQATKSELELRDEALDALMERFARFGVHMTDNNRQQAMIPAGSELIPNPVGTAPGFIVETPDGAIIAMPGVPREMKRLMLDSVLPYLHARSKYQGVIRRRVLRTIGIGESTLDDLLGNLMLRSNPTVGLAAKTAQADIRITARAESADAAEAMIDDVAQEVHALVGEHIYSEESGEELEAVVVGLLNEKRATIAVLETNAAGPLEQRIGMLENGPDVMPQAVSVGDSALPSGLVKLLEDVDTVMSAEGAMASADALRIAAGTTYGLAVIGTADPDGGIYGTADGRTQIALATDNEEAALDLRYGGTDDYTEIRIANQALYLLWQNLRNR